MLHILAMLMFHVLYTSVYSVILNSTYSDSELKLGEEGRKEIHTFFKRPTL